MRISFTPHGPAVSVQDERFAMVKLVAQHLVLRYLPVVVVLATAKLLGG